MISFRLSKKEIKKLIQYMYAVSQEDVELMLIESAQESKNLGIIAITLATRYAIEGNLPPDIFCS